MTDGTDANDGSCIGDTDRYTPPWTAPASTSVTWNYDGRGGIRTDGGVDDTESCDCCLGKGTIVSANIRSLGQDADCPVCGGTGKRSVDADND